MPPMNNQPFMPSVPPQMQQPMFSPLPPQQPKGSSGVGLVVAIVVLSLGLIGALAFGYWAFAERQDYKDNSDEKVAAAVKVAEKETTDANNARYAEESKSPVKLYLGPSSYGSISLSYPKTWSGYVTQGSSGSPFDAYFHPGVVPEAGSGSKQQAVALRLEVRNLSYDKVVAERTSEVKNGALTASPYALPKVPEQVGTKFSGKLSNTFNGTEYVLPLRDKTLVITTQTDQFTNDMNTYILPNITFVP